MIIPQSLNTNVTIISKKDIDTLLKHYSLEEIEFVIIQLMCERSKYIKKNKSKKIINDFIEPCIFHDNTLDNNNQIKNFLIERKIELNLDSIIRIFELLIHENDRKLNGAYYTPNIIVNYIIEKTINGKDYKICDPACGCGVFLIKTVQKLYEILRILRTTFTSTLIKIPFTV